MLDQKVKDVFGLASVEGEVGIEIEMETQNMIPNVGGVSKLWRLEHDGSLKGFGTEFVTRRPHPREGVPDLMSNFRKKLLTDLEVKIKDSIRAGVHIHINMQENTLKDVFRFLMCFYSIETPLVKFSGKSREGNLFCLRHRDACYSLHQIAQAVEEGDIYNLRTDNLRYSAMNFQSLFKYGSLESRSLATTPSLNNIVDWVNILLAIKDYSLQVENCWDSISLISGNGPREYMRMMVGDKYADMLDYPELEADVMEDVRNMQYTCHVLSEKGI